MRRFVNADIIHGSISDSTSLNRYAYVNGNPVSFIDPFGLAAERGESPTALEAAYMAEHIYNATDDDYFEDLGDGFGGWKLVKIYDPGLNGIGVKVGLYSRITSDRKRAYCIVYAGTNMDVFSAEGSDDVFIDSIDCVSDWVNNITQPFGCSFDMQLSISYAENFVKDHPDNYITFIGHSKGGAEAAAAAVATDKDAVLFNPASASLGLYWLSSRNYSGDMMVYVVEGEILNTIFGPISKPIDGFNYIQSDKGGAFKKHSMDSVINALS